MATAATAIAGAGVAFGQTDAVPPPPDTDLTPVTKVDQDWKQVAGARFGDEKVIEGSPTTFDTDLFTVAFRNPRLGLAAGSVCAATPAKPEAASTCERVPVVYRYVEEATGKAEWTKAALPGGGDPGYVGGIAWIDHRQAIAVGGDGCYPRREEPCPDGSTPAGGDPAGRGRAWLYQADADRWTELDLTAQRADGMGGMTAIDFDPGSSPTFGAAGAYGQIWEWRDGGFAKKVDRASPATDIYAGNLFQHRVRDLRFYADPLGSGVRPQAFALTAGCCELNAVHNTPRLLAYGRRAGGSGGGAASGPHRWYVRRLGLDPRERVDPDALSNAGGALGQDVPDAAEDELRGPWRANMRPDVPDSFYSLGAVRESEEVCAIASAGGPERPDEAPSMLTAGQNIDAIGEVTPTPLLDAALTLANETSATPTRLALGSARLVAGDGSAEETASDLYTTGSKGCAPNWMVGHSRTTTVEGLGARGLLVATHRGKPQGMKLKGWDFLGSILRTGVKVEDLERPLDPSRIVEDQDRLLKPLESNFYAAPTYSLNDVQMVVDSGSGWAVGDHGSIVTTSDAESASADKEPDPPALGERREGRLPDLAAYERLAPLSPPGAAGVVPDQYGTGRLDGAGHAYQDLGRLGIGTIANVVISRDGAEGLAFGEEGRVAYYDGNGWSTCSSETQASGTPYGCRGEQLAAGSFDAAARVPLERDGDPHNDDEFEVFALSAGGPLRYRDGIWRREDSGALGGLQVAGFAVAFTSPDDGWVITGQGNAHALPPYDFFRFDGESWRRCGCDPGKRLPVRVPSSTQPAPGGSISGMVVAEGRVYVFGFRVTGTSWVSGAIPYPLILSWGSGDDEWQGEGDGAYDPGFDQGDPLENTADTGVVTGLAVSNGPEGFEGWAVGGFGGGIRTYSAAASPVFSAETPLMRLDQSGHWHRFRDTGPMREYVEGVEARAPGPGGVTGANQMLVSADGADGPDTIAQSTGRVFQFNETRERFEMLPTGRRPASMLSSDPLGSVSVVVPDRRGGHFAAVGPSLFHWTDRPRKPVFREAPTPSSDTARPLIDLAGTADGTVWASTGTDVLYRYDRLTGWNRASIPGWDVGRILTRPAAVNAIAVGPDGHGLAVGKGGRIAQLSPRRAALDPAAGRRCDPRLRVPPCSTSWDLHAVDIAPDGSALAGGDHASLLWRPPGGSFRSIARPDVTASARISAISMPAADRAWVTTDNGLVFAGRKARLDDWSWQLENLDEKGDALKIGSLHAIEVDGAGHGYALAESERLLERTNETLPWRPVRVAGHGNLRSVAFSAGEGDGVLLGTTDGAILTKHGQSFSVARPGGGWASRSIDSVVLVPGLGERGVEAWALEGNQRLLHYSSDSAEPLMQPAALDPALPDSSPRRPGEIALAAFGKSDCHSSNNTRCNEMSGLTAFNEVIAERIGAELVDRDPQESAPALALFTGDSVDGAGYPANEPAETAAPKSVADDVPQNVGIQLFVTSYYVSSHGSKKVRRFSELVADRFGDRGTPLLGALGGRDLSAVTVCGPGEDGCESTSDQAQAGENLAWRQAMATRPGPWGAADPPRAGGFEVRPVEAGWLTRRMPEGETPGSEPGVASRRLPTGGASTHYALDLVDGDGDARARLVFLDSSLRSLSAADHQQQPLEPGGGQLAWLERMLCFEGDATGTVERCTRKPGQQAIVVSNTPTYSYGPGIGTQTATDMFTLETALLRHRANLVVSGRIGWNGMYWATAPGVHEPCPGEGYREAPPAPGRRVCGEGAGVAGDPLGTPDAGAVSNALSGTTAPVQPALDEVTTAAGSLEGTLPFVVASGGGGPLAGEDPNEGFWYGYSLIRLDASGDTRKTIVEQRPIYDWVGIEAQEHTLRPGQRMTLRGFGRVPDGTTNHGRLLPLRLDRIASPAITHRYDLLLADPDRPWMPYLDANADYVPLDSSVAAVDSQTGAIRAGRGRGTRTYAIGMLSVGDKTATYPLVFEPRRSFAPRPARIRLPPLPRAARAPAAQAPLRMADAAPPPAPPPGAPPASPLASQTLQPPQPPQVPSLPAQGLAAPPPAPSLGMPPAPPPPPAPPSVPPQQQPAPLALNAKLQPISLVPSVNPPAPPPVNPAPPAGGAARKEAKQRQAAAAKSEDSSGSEAQEAGGDLAQGGDTPTGVQATRRAVDKPAPATRRSRDRPAPSFTTLARPDQASAWSRGALYGGGLGLAALVLAFGWITVRPRPGRRRPHAMPAWSRIRR